MVTTEEKDFNNQMDRIVNLFPRVPLSLPNGLTSKVAMVAGGNHAWAQQHGLPLSKSELAMATAESPYASSRDQH